MGKLTLALGLGVGYVLGTRAGRARYEQIQQAATRLTGRPEIQEAVGKVKESLPPALQSTVGGPSGGGGDGKQAKEGKDTRPSSGPAATGSFPLEDDEEVMAQTHSALVERTAAAPATGDPGPSTGPVPSNAAPEDEDPIAQTHSAFTERTADAPETEHSR